MGGHRSEAHEVAADSSLGNAPPKSLVMTREDGAFRREGLLGRVAPFAGLALLAFALAPLPPEASAADLLAAQALTAAIFAAVAFVPWARFPRLLEVLPPLFYVVVVALIREAEGGASSGVSPLVLIPLMWVALYGTRAQLALVIAAIGALFVVPVIFFDSGRYPATEWERAILWTAASLIVGFTVQALVQRIREQARRLEEMVRTDELTGMPNRFAWKEFLDEGMKRARYAGDPLSIALLDIDGFEAFSEQRGRELSERLQRICGAVWLREIRPSDLLVHWSGSEFRLALPQTGLSDAVEVAEALRRATPGGQTSSVGVACWDGAESDEELIARADDALRQAKRHGRARTMAATASGFLEAAEALAVGADEAAHPAPGKSG